MTTKNKDTFYNTNEKYKTLVEKLPYEDRMLLIEIISEAQTWQMRDIK